MLGHSVLIVAATITWTIPIATQAYRPNLHKPHNDEVYKVNLDQSSTSKYIVTRRQSNRDSNRPVFLYQEKNLVPHSAIKPINRQRDDVLLTKIEELTTLVKMVLIRSLDGDEKLQRKNRQILLYEANVPQTDRNESPIWLIPQTRNFETKEEISPDFSVTKIIHTAIPYEKQDVSSAKKNQVGERGGNVSSMRLQEPH